MKEQHIKLIKILVCTSLIMIGLIIIISSIYFPEVFKDKESILYYLNPGTISGLAMITMYFPVWIDTIGEYKNINTIDDYYERMRSRISDTNKDITELMLSNMREIKEYYSMSKIMAKSSFALAVIMSIGGFFIMIFAIAYILSNNLSMIQSILPIIASAIIEVIAGSAIIVYKKSLEQLDKYYDALHDNEVFLSVINLANKISPENKDDTYNYIIKTKLHNSNTMTEHSSG